MFIRPLEKTAIFTLKQELSYSEVLKNIEYYSEILGSMTDRRVLIISENRPEYIYSIYAVWRSGGTVTPVDYMSVNDEIAYIINDCEPAAVFTSAKLLQKVRDSIAQTEKDVRIIVFEDVSQDKLERVPAPLDFDDRERTALLIYTSGTTGSPKGVMLSFSNLMANLEKLAEAGYYTEDEVVLMILPLHHIFPIMGTVIAVFAGGGATAIAPSLNSADIMEMMQKARPTMLLGVPRFYEMLIKGIMNKIDGSFIAKRLFRLAKVVNSQKFSGLLFRSVHSKFGGKVRHIISGGARLDPVAWRKFKTLGFVIAEGYGMTEAAPMITFPRPGKGRPGCVGTELEKGTVKIIDGEVVATGKNIMKGYYNRPEETAEVLKDGWLYTGDLGRFDNRGRLYITGRKKEIIVLPSGKNINPVEIEKALEMTDGIVHEAAVVQSGDSLTAIIRPDERILVERQIPNLEEFIRWEVVDRYNQNASHHKKILKFVLVNEPLPRTRLEKLQRFKLESFLTARETAKKSSDVPDDVVYMRLSEYFSKNTEKQIYPDDHIEIDLGLDSLDKIELVGFITAEYRIRITEADLLNNATVRRLSEFITSEKMKSEVTGESWKTMLKDNLHIDIDLPRSAFYHLWIRFYLLTILRFFFRLRFRGAQEITEGPVIFAPNHQSVIDGLFVVSKIPSAMFRKTYFFAKEKHFKRWWRKYLANRNNIIIMKEGEELMDSIKRMASVLKKGRNIIIFPEGTRSRDGKLADFKQTFTLLSCELNVPVIPVAIKGAFEAFPRNRKLPHPFKKIEVVYLPAIDPQGHTKESLTEAVRNAINTELSK